jgi:hypothetical protein
MRVRHACPRCLLDGVRVFDSWHSADETVLSVVVEAPRSDHARGVLAGGGGGQGRDRTADLPLFRRVRAGFRVGWMRTEPGTNVP